MTLDADAVMSLVEEKHGLRDGLVQHPLGFLRLLLTAEDRLSGGHYLHVWPTARIPRQSRDYDLHCHIFDLASTVLFGCVRNASYVVRPSPDGDVTEVMAVHGVDGARMESTGSRYEIDRETTTEIRAGDSYTIPRGEYHATVGVDHPTATLMLKTNVDVRAHPRHLVPVRSAREARPRRVLLAEDEAWQILMTTLADNLRLG
jgi:hypothetical protein